MRWTRLPGVRFDTVEVSVIRERELGRSRLWGGERALGSTGEVVCSVKDEWGRIEPRYFVLFLGDDVFAAGHVRGVDEMDAAGSEGLVGWSLQLILIGRVGGVVLLG